MVSHMQMHVTFPSSENTERCCYVTDDQMCLITNAAGLMGVKNGN